MTNQTPESAIDDSVVEAAYRAFCEARFGKALSDDEHDALRSRLELTWIKPTIAAAFRATNMLREPGELAAHDAEVAARQIDAPSVREAIGEVLADMEATAEGTHIASSLALLQEITDAVIRAAVSPPSRTAKRTGYETVGHGVGEHSQKITARAAEYRKAVES